jgi:hypothetical protein
VARGAECFPQIQPGDRGLLWALCGVCRTQSKSIFVQSTYSGSGNGAFLAVVAIPRINNLRVIHTPNSSTPAASTMSFIINYLQAWRFSDKLYSQSVVIFRTWVPSGDYISLESLNRHHFLLCRDSQDSPKVASSECSRVVLYDRAAPSPPQEVHLVGPVHIPGLASERYQSAD